MPGWDVQVKGWASWGMYKLEDVPIWGSASWREKFNAWTYGFFQILYIADII